MQLPSLPAAEGVTMENVLVNLTETVLPLGSFAEMMALERHAEMLVLVFDHPTLDVAINVFC